MLQKQAEIFPETAGLQQNTIKDGLPANKSDGRAVPFGIRLMAHPEHAADAFNRPSFLPCLNHRVDGIFRPGGGRLLTISGRACLTREKLPRANGLRADG
jgi:hypothetical protein